MTLMPPEKEMTSGQIKGPQRIVALDFLRGLAIFLVLFRHSIIPPEDAGVLSPMVTFIKNLGWSGVDLFFVLSGFLVSGLLYREHIKTGHIDVRRFVIRRGFKIWPLYYFYLVLTSVLTFRRTGYSVSETASLLWGNYVHIQNYTGTPLPHTWSLAVEEHFYLLLPLVLVGLLRVRSSVNAIVLICAGVFGACLAYRVGYFLAGYEFSYIPIQWATHARIDSLSCGVLIGYFYHYKKEMLINLENRRGGRIIPWLLMLCLVPLAVLDMKHPLMWTLGYTLNFIGYGGLLHLVLQNDSVLQKNILVRATAWVGMYSYPIYLFHFGVTRDVIERLMKLGILRNMPECRWLLFFLLYAGIAIVIGFLLGRFLETPALRLRDRLFPRVSA